MKITHKIILGFILVGAFIVITGLIGIITTNIIGNKLELITQVTSPTVELVDDLTITLVKSNKIVHEYAAEYNANNLDSLRRTFDELNDDFDELERTMRRLVEDEDIIQELNTIIKKFDGFKDKAEKVISTHKAELAENDEEEVARYRGLKGALLKQLDDDVAEATAILQKITLEAKALNRDTNRKSVNAVKITIVVISLITIAGICLAIAIGFFFTKAIVRPVNELAMAATKVSEGNFDVKVKEPKSHDEINHLANTFNKMVVSLKNMLEESPRLKRFMQITPSSEKVSQKEEQYKVNVGKSYIVKEPDAKKAYDIFLDKVTHHYQGLCISRTNPESVRKRYNLQKTLILWLSDTKESNIFSSSDLLIIGKLITDFLAKSQKGIILLDRIDYLIAKHGFEEVLRFIVKVNDKIMTTNALLLVPVDPALMKTTDLSFLEKEMDILPGTADKTDLPPDLLTIVEFIEATKGLGKQVTFKDIGQKFSITAPTTQKRLQELQQRGIIKVIKAGRNKIVALTEKGRELLEKK